MRNFPTLLLALLVLLAGCGCVLAADATPGAASAAPQLVTLTGKLGPLTTPKAGASLVAMLTTDTLTARLELAPQSYLDKIGLSLKEGDVVTVTGKQHINAKDQSVSMGVQTLKLGDQTYQLRDADGVALWQPSRKHLEVNGTVKDIITPDAAATGKARLVSFTLVTDETSRTVLLAPVDFLAKIGLVLKDGDTVRVSGFYDAHAEKSPLMAVTVKYLDTLYTLRSPQGKALWEQAAAPAPKINEPAK